MQLFWKKSSFEEVAFQADLMLCKSTCLKTSSSNVTLNEFLLQKSSCSDKKAVLKNYLFLRSSCLVEKSLWKSKYSEKNNYCEEVAVLKR